MQKLTLPGDILLLPCNKNKRKIEDNIKDIKILIRHLKNDSHKKFKSITIVDKKKNFKKRRKITNLYQLLKPRTGSLKVI